MPSRATLVTLPQEPSLTALSDQEMFRSASALYLHTDRHPPRFTRVTFSLANKSLYCKPITVELRMRGGKSCVQRRRRATGGVN